MSLEIRKRGDKAYLYFEYSERGSRQYLYLGTSARHRLDSFEKALKIVRLEIDRYSSLEANLLGLLLEDERRRLKRTTGGATQQTKP